MTQSGAFEKPKPILVAPPQVGVRRRRRARAAIHARSAQAPMTEEAPAEDGLVAESNAQVKEDEPSRLSLQ